MSLSPAHLVLSSDDDRISRWLAATSHDPDAHRPGVDGYEVLCLQKQKLEPPARRAERRDDNGAGFYADYRVVLNLSGSDVRSWACANERRGGGAVGEYLRRVYFHGEESSRVCLRRRICCIAEARASPARDSRSWRWREEAAFSARRRRCLPGLMSVGPGVYRTGRRGVEDYSISRLVFFSRGRSRSRILSKGVQAVEEGNLSSSRSWNPGTGPRELKCGELVRTTPTLRGVLFLSLEHGGGYVDSGLLVVWLQPSGTKTPDSGRDLS